MNDVAAARLFEHWCEAGLHFQPDQMVGIFLQGSQNYGLETEQSDVDTKLIVLPTFRDIVMNKKAVSTTHIRANDEHIDFKDIRLMFEMFKKQNINFVEILFTPYNLVSSLYAEYINELDANKEAIAHYCPWLAVKTMKGMAMEKYHALKHPYPSKVDVINKYGYDPKQLHHILRLADFIHRYVEGETYEACLIPEQKEYLKEVKRGLHTLEEAEWLAKDKLDLIVDIADTYTSNFKCDKDKQVEDLLSDVLYDIMKQSVRGEIGISYQLM